MLENAGHDHGVPSETLAWVYMYVKMLYLAFASALNLVSVVRFVSDPARLGRERTLIGSYQRAFLKGSVAEGTAGGLSRDGVLVLDHSRGQGTSRPMCVPSDICHVIHR